MRWMWIDRVVELTPRERIVTIKNVSLAEEHLHDHFGPGVDRPALPVMPASLIVEGVAQSGGILVGHASGFTEKVVLAKIGNAEFSREVVPGETLRYTVTIQQYDRAGAATQGVVEVMRPGTGAPGWERIGTVDLMFSHVDQSMDVRGDGPEVPEHNFAFGETFRTLLRMSGVEEPQPPPPPPDHR